VRSGQIISRLRLIRRDPVSLRPDDVDAIKFVLRQMIDTR
jgi:hypothetical protein